MRRPLLAAALALGLPACSSTGEPARRASVAPASLEAAVAAPTAWANASGSAEEPASPPAATPPATVVVLPPGAGEVLGVRDRPFANGFTQTVSLRGEPNAKGANQVEVAVATAKRSGSNQAPLWKPGEAGIKAEIRARFPGVAMQVIPQPRQNAYGPVGIAVGRQGETRCLYAWQWIEDVRGSGRGTLRFLTTGQAVPATLRVRLCRAGVTADDLAAVVEQLTIDLGQRSDATLEIRAVQAQAPATSPAPARRPAKKAARRAPEREPDPAPAVTWGTDGRQYLAPVQAGRTAPAAYPGSSSASYAGAGGPPRGPGPQKGKGLDPSLPAQAYLGPSGQAARVKTTGALAAEAMPSARAGQP